MKSLSLYLTEATSEAVKEFRKDFKEFKYQYFQNDSKFVGGIIKNVSSLTLYNRAKTFFTTPDVYMPALPEGVKLDIADLRYIYLPTGLAADYLEGLASHFDGKGEYLEIHICNNCDCLSSAYDIFSKYWKNINVILHVGANGSNNPIGKIDRDIKRPGYVMGMSWNEKCDVDWPRKKMDKITISIHQVNYTSGWEQIFDLKGLRSDELIVRGPMKNALAKAGCEKWLSDAEAALQKNNKIGTIIMPQ